MFRPLPGSNRPSTKKASPWRPLPGSWKTMASKCRPLPGSTCIAVGDDNGDGPGEVGMGPETK